MNSGVYPENAASQKVAQKIGMSHLGKSSEYYGVELELFELKRPNTIADLGTQEE